MAQERDMDSKKKKTDRLANRWHMNSVNLNPGATHHEDNESERLTYTHGVVISPTTPLTTLRGKTEIPLTVTPSYGSYTLFGSPTSPNTWVRKINDSRLYLK